MIFRKCIPLLTIFFFLYFVWPAPESKTPFISISPPLSFKAQHNQQSDSVKEYSFEDPEMAKKLLEMLDQYVPQEEEEYYDPSAYSKRRYDEGHLGLTFNEKYCDEVRNYIVDRTEEVFRFNNFFNDRSKKTFVKSEFTAKLGNVLMPDASESLKKRDAELRIYPLSPEIHHFFAAGPMDVYQIVGKTFACTFQEYSHIPGHSLLVRKDKITEAFTAYEKEYEDRPHCFRADHYLPKSWLMNQESQCRDFFDNYFNTEEYQKLKQKHGIIYISKIGAGAHKGEGVDVVDGIVEADIRDEFQNGDLCGQIQRNLIMQQYIYNPLLINNRKMDFRIYLLIASTNPLIAYYHDGYAKVSLLPYDTSSTKKETLITNTGFEYYLEEAEKGNYILGMNEKELKLAHFWSLERIQEYLLSVGKIKDPNWLDNYLRPTFKKAMIHMIRATSKPFLKRSQLYELIGIDFMLDDDLNVWIIEANPRPRLEPFSITEKTDREPFFSLIADMMEIQFGLARSRLKRVIVLINQMTRESEKYSLRGVNDFNLPEKIELFKEATKNRFEPEFEPKPLNTWSKIMDENLEGVERYQRLIESDCI